MSDQEHHKNWRENRDRFFHAAEIQNDEKQNRADLKRHFHRARAAKNPGKLRERVTKQAKQGITGCGDRDGDREDVVDDQRATAERADLATEHFARHEVTATAAGECFDDVAVTSRNDDYSKN